MPRASDRQQMELAVNMPEQLPPGGAGGLLEPMAFLLRHCSGGYLAHGIKERVEVGLLAAAAAAGKHGAAGDENGGDV